MDTYTTFEEVNDNSFVHSSDNSNNSLNEDYMLSTYDNPFNPFTNFELWFKYDLVLGHDCCGTLAREAAVSDVSSDEIKQEETYRAMDYICQREPTIYRKVKRSDYGKELISN